MLFGTAGELCSAFNHLCSYLTSISPEPRTQVGEESRVLPIVVTCTLKTDAQEILDLNRDIVLANRRYKTDAHSLAYAIQERNIPVPDKTVYWIARAPEGRWTGLWVGCPWYE